MIVIVGLGNPGKEYECTYHNMGYMCVDAFAELHGLKFTKTKYNAMYAEGMVEGEKVAVLKPTTYMNLSGLSVAECVRKLKLPLTSLLVVYDDIDLEVGVIRLRHNGSAGTHNGMRNIIAQLGTSEFSRLRIGIGRDSRMDLKDYVLSKVSGDKLKVVEDNMSKVTGVITAFVKFKGNTEKIDINNY